MRFINSTEPFSEENNKFLQQAEKSISEGFDKGNIIGLKNAYNDCVSDAKFLLNDEQLAKLDMELRNRFGVGLKAAEKKRQKMIGNILKRGVVETEDEYRMLLDRADEIHADQKKNEDLKAINLLLKTGLVKEK
jgi:hypothetical protein